MSNTNYHKPILLLLLLSSAMLCGKEMKVETVPVPSLKPQIREIHGENMALTQIESNTGFWRKGAEILFVNNRLTGVDARHFVVIKQDQNFGTDGKSLFWRTEKIAPVSIHDWTIIKGSYSRDNDRVFHVAREIKGADPETFKVIDSQNGIARDKNRIYSDEASVPLDPTHFRYFAGGIMRDDTKVIKAVVSESGTQFETLPVSNPKTFERIGFDYYKDSTHIYYVEFQLEVLEGADRDSFHAVDWESAKDANGAWSRAHRVTDIEQGKPKR